MSWINKNKLLFVKDKIIFNTINEIYIKLNFTESSIRNAIKNKTLYGGCYWKYKE